MGRVTRSASGRSQHTKESNHGSRLAGTEPPKKKRRLLTKKEIKNETEEANNNEINESSGYSSESNSTEVKGITIDDYPWGGLSEFERKALESKQARMQMLKDMGVLDAKISFEQSAPKKNIRIKRVKLSPAKLEPRRKSARLSHQKPAFKQMTNEEHNFLEKACTKTQSYTNETPSRNDSKPCHLSTRSMSGEQQENEDFLKSIALPADYKNTQYWNQDIDDLTKAFSKMRSSEEGVAKVVPNRICSLLVHPVVGKTLIFAGDTRGSFGIWDVNNQENGLECYNVHTNCIYCITTDKRNSSNIFTSSYDGSLRQLDLLTGITDEVYGFENDELGYSCHSQLDDNTILLTGRKKVMDRVDLRTKKCIGSFKVLQSGRTKVVTVHPTNQNYFAIAGGTSEVSLWDQRFMKKNATCVSSYNHSRSVQGLEFSPVSGKYLMSTSWDDSIIVSEFREQNNLSVMTRLRHCNNTGRWLTPFKATWVPDQETAFVVGSLLHPRRTQLFDCSGKLVSDLKSEYVNSVNSVLSFHPDRPLLAGANSSGRVHVFSIPEVQ